MIKYCNKGDLCMVVDMGKYIGIRLLKDLVLKPGKNIISTDVYLWPDKDIILIIDMHKEVDSAYLENRYMINKEELCPTIFNIKDEDIVIKGGQYIFLVIPILSPYAQGIEIKEVSALWFV